LAIPTSNPFYSTPFFPRCKYFFQKKSTFLKKFSKWKENKPKKPIESLPNQSKNRAKEFAEGGTPKNSAENQGCSVAQTQVALAHAEAEIHPDCAHQAAKKQVAQEPGAHRPEKIEAQPQRGAQQQADTEAQGAYRWFRHPQNRRLRGS
jgi:hypothetical protein